MPQGVSPVSVQSTHVEDLVGASYPPRSLRGVKASVRRALEVLSKVWSALQLSRSTAFRIASWEALASSIQQPPFMPLSSIFLPTAQASVPRANKPHSSCPSFDNLPLISDNNALSANQQVVGK